MRQPTFVGFIDHCAWWGCQGPRPYAARGPDRADGASLRPVLAHDATDPNAVAERIEHPVDEEELKQQRTVSGVGEPTRAELPPPAVPMSVNGLPSGALNR
ncbi:hypothetical protein GCM10017559_60720 [Streptosporangium longisporum]|uniref:Uncharacterized protein n=1 Tax=Streptosporangium longisporum TaxID=46187 RepID=A0ABP6KXW6_9ACTN